MEDGKCHRTVLRLNNEQNQNEQASKPTNYLACERGMFENQTADPI